MKKVVITGLGVITPIGNNLEEYWESLKKGKSGVTKISKFDTSDFPSQIAGEVKGFKPEDFIEKRDLRRMDPYTQYAVAASRMAIEDSGIDLSKEDTTRIGVIIGSGIGGMVTLEEQHKILLTKGPRRLSPLFVPMMISDIATGYVSMIFKLKGPNYAVTSACATSSHAIGDAYMLIKRGSADVMVAGGSEAAITPVSLGGFASMKALSLRNNEPEKASRPFDAKRDGFVIGEGSGIVILESEEHALKRNARIYGELAGIGFTADAYHLTAPAPGGEGAVRGIKACLEDAKMKPEDIDYINAHGTSTEWNDKIETTAIKTVFGEYAYKIPISSTKSMTGHLLGAAGGIELVASILCMKNSIIHPTINYEYKDDECDLDYTPNVARKKEIKALISNTFGFGGHNACLLVRKYDEKW
ncbi:beta-ketoacyl-[acyl-carrier-protein] synthase II [candidate division KSB1 bacterium]|nr:MAG: beta-ketoacyl-[acyl-carrier-protein] synthase II [candidate division KSB1 bacterium]